MHASNSFHRPGSCDNISPILCRVSRTNTPRYHHLISICKVLPPRQQSAVPNCRNNNKKVVLSPQFSDITIIACLPAQAGVVDRPQASSRHPTSPQVHEPSTPWAPGKLPRDLTHDPAVAPGLFTLVLSPYFLASSLIKEASGQLPLFVHIL